MSFQVTNSYIKKNFVFISLLFFFILSRILILSIQITPDPKWIGLMQHINLVLLNENLLSSLFYFHSQPPIWNLLIGIGVKFFGTSSVIISKYILCINLLFSMGIIYFSIKSLDLLKINRLTTFFIIFFLIILSPSIIFYENFLSYSHFTCFNIFLIKYYFIKLFKNDKPKYEVKIYVFASILSLTWSAYTAFFFLIIFFMIFSNRNFSLKKHSILIFLFFLTISHLPAIKNKIYFNFFTNSTWTGINASQALGYDRVEWPKCSFELSDVKKHNKLFKANKNNQKYLEHQLLNNNRYNDLGFLYKSKYCSSKIYKHLVNNFETLLIEKFNRFLSIHGHLSFDYLFKPLGWESRFLYLEYLNQNDFFKISVFVFFMSIYLSIFTIFIKSFLNKNKSLLDKFVIINIFFYTYLIVISIFGSSWEQERMRYTEYSFIMYAIAIIIKRTKVFKN